MNALPPMGQSLDLFSVSVSQSFSVFSVVFTQIITLAQMGSVWIKVALRLVLYSHSWFEPNKTSGCWSAVSVRHQKTAPYRTDASPLSQPPKSNFRVRAKEPSCPNEKALDEERRPFSREAELTVANKRHDRDEIGSPESIPAREEGWGREEAGEMRRGWERDREWQKETREDKWDHERERGTVVGAGAGSGPAERNRDDRRAKERKGWYYTGRGWKTELSLGVIHGLILTVGVIKPSVGVISILP